MAKFEKAFNDLKEKVSKGSTTYSRGDLIGLTDALINDTEYCYPSISKKGDSYETEDRYPARDLRASMKKVVKKEFGVSDAELTKLDTTDLPKDMAAAISEIGSVSIKKYMETGKTYKFPMTGADESTMKVSIRNVDDIVRATSRIEETAPGSGKYQSVPTGKTVRTKKHATIVAKNTVPGWLKEEV